VPWGVAATGGIGKEGLLVQAGWHTATDVIAPHVVRVITPQGRGSGFLVAYARGGALSSIATAAHVVDHAHYWEQPIRIQHYRSGHAKVLRPPDRAILIDETLDTAAIVFLKEDLPFPLEPLALIQERMRLKQGVEMGWLGFPAISPDNLCFFSGRVSCWIEQQSAYFVDGIAINGVSGGPAFSIHPESGVELVGVVSAYMPNRATGEVLPGLCVVRDVKQFQELVSQLRTLDQAKEKETVPVAPVPPIPQPNTGPG
jgi:hypothetical protein